MNIKAEIIKDEVVIEIIHNVTASDKAKGVGYANCLTIVGDKNRIIDLNEGYTVVFSADKPNN